MIAVVFVAPWESRALISVLPTVGPEKALTLVPNPRLTAPQDATRKKVPLLEAMVMLSLPSEVAVSPAACRLELAVKLAVRKLARSAPVRPSPVTVAPPVMPVYPLSVPPMTMLWAPLATLVIVRWPAEFTEAVTRALAEALIFVASIEALPTSAVVRVTVVVPPPSRVNVIVSPVAPPVAVADMVPAVALPASRFTEIVLPLDPAPLSEICNPELPNAAVLS